MIGEVIKRIPLSGVAAVDTQIYGVKWASKVIPYSFPTTGSTWISGYGEGEQATFSALNSTQSTFISNALKLYDNVSGWDFKKVEEPGSTGILRIANSAKPSTSLAYMPEATEEAGDIWLGTGADAPSNPTPGSYDYTTIVHEIGHTLGLKHPHDNDNGYPVADPMTDGIENSVMSYRSYLGQTIGSEGYSIQAGSYPTTIMMNDISTMQYLYGADYNYNSGDTVYSFSPKENKIFQTVWDGNGNDTYDCSAYTVPVTIQLQPGEWSTLAPAQLADLGDGKKPTGSVANARLYQGDERSLIENAVGGSGNDILRGNQTKNVLSGGGGDDQLWGGNGGADTMFGGAGSDRYWWSSADGMDSIAADNTNYADTLNIYGSLTKDNVRVLLQGNDLVIGADAANQITIKNWSLAPEYNLERIYFDSDKHTYQLSLRRGEVVWTTIA